jgi:hypothetical protein
MINFAQTIGGDFRKTELLFAATAPAWAAEDRVILERIQAHIELIKRTSLRD